MPDESIHISNHEYFEAKAKDGWIIKVLGSHVNERRENDDWTQDRREYLEGKNFKGALTIAFRLIELHGGPSTEELPSPLKIPTATAIKTIGGIEHRIEEFWLDSNGGPAYGYTKGVKTMAASKKTHERLCRFIESKLATFTGKS